MAKHHYLIVGPCDSCPTDACDCRAEEVDPSFTLRIECPAVTDACAGWVECRKDCNVNNGFIEEVDNEGQGERHGERHQFIQGILMVPTGNCFIQETDFHEAARDAFERDHKEMTPGRYAVSHDCPDVNAVDLYLIDEKSEVTQ